MRKLGNVILSLALIFVLVGCSKKDPSKKVTGTNDEIAVSLFQDMMNNDYDDLYDKYDFTKELDEIARSKRFASILSPYFSTLGSFKSSEVYYSQEKANCTFVYFPCHFENGDFNVVVTMSEDQKVANVSFNDYQTKEEI